MISLPKISSRLDALRIQARCLAGKGFNEAAIELMKISRGEVKIEADCRLFGLNAVDMKKARTCTNTQRLMIAANQVSRARISVKSEDEFSESIERVSKGNLRWPKGKVKKVLIAEQAKTNNVSASTLDRFMKDKGWIFLDPLDFPPFEYPDWHPDYISNSIEKGEINS